MARSTRTHRPGDFHYLVLRANAGRRLFPQTEDFADFAALVARHIEGCHIRLLAFCWVAEEACFALQVSSAPLGKFVQRVAGQHAQRINRRAGVRGHVFRQRYRAVAVTEPQLPLLVSHLHLMPVRLGLAADPAEYPWSSHRAYLGVQRLSWVTTEPVLQWLRGAARGGPDAYLGFMREQIERRGALAAARGASSPADEEREFLRSLAPVARRGSADLEALDRLIERVAACLNVGRDELQSRSRRRALSLGRAVIAWHATRSGAAKLSDVARHLGRHPSTLSIAIERYRLRRPQMFGERLDDLSNESLMAGPSRPAPEREG